MAAMRKTFPKLYSRSEIERIFAGLGEAPLPQKTFWLWTKAEEAIIPPSRLGESRKEGDRWDVSGVVLLRWVSHLRGGGVPLQRIRRAFSYLRREIPKVLADDVHDYAFIVGPGKNPVLVRQGETVGVELARASGQLIALDCITVRETVAAVRRFDERRAA